MQERVIREVREIYSSDKRPQGAKRRKLEGALGVIYKWKSRRQLSNNLKFSNIVEEVNLKNWNTLRKVYGDDAKGDERMLNDIRNEEREYTDEFSGKFVNYEIHIPAKSNDENRSWTKVVTRNNYSNYADFSSMVIKQMTMAIRGLSKFHGVDPFMVVEGHGGEEMQVLSPEGLTELRKTMKDHGDRLSDLDRDEAEALKMIRIPQKQTQAEEQGGEQTE